MSTLKLYKNRLRTIYFFVAASAALLLLPSSKIQAQLSDAYSVPYSKIISLNPLLLIASGDLWLDYEHRVATEATVGASFFTYKFRHSDYMSADASYRYYLSGRAMDGFSIGGVVGAVRISERDSSSATDHAMSIGFLFENQTLLGPQERLSLSLGVGTSRLFFADNGHSLGKMLPKIRASIGWGF